MCGMDTSILYEKTISLWHVLLIAAGVAIVLLAAPPAMRMGFMARKEEPPAKKKCFRVTWMAALIAGMGTPLVVAVLCNYFAGDLLVYEWHWALKLVVGALLAGSVFGVCLAAMDLLLVGRSSMVWSRVLPAAIVCAVGVSAVDLTLAGSFGRFRTLERRSIDRARLESIFHGLNAYYNIYHAYPDDLRRLADAQLVQKTELVSVFSHAQSEIRASDASPYGGPVDFTLVQLPSDAYDDIVWVCQSPSPHDDEGAYVLYKCGAVKWLSPQGVVAEMAKSIQRMRQFTQDEMAYLPHAYGPARPAAKAASSTSSPASAPASSPASAPSTRATTLPATTSSPAPDTMPATAPASMPATEPGLPATVPASMPTTTPAGMPTARPASGPSTIPATGPATPPATMPATTPTSSPATAPTTRPTTAPAATAPASRPTTSPATAPVSREPQAARPAEPSSPATAPAPPRATAPSPTSTAAPTSAPGSRPVATGAENQK
jgi:hypothetical protein